MWRGPALLPLCAAVSALRVGEVRLQEYVLIDPSHQAVDVRGHLLIALHQRQHDVQGFLSVARQVPPKLTHTCTKTHTKHSKAQSVRKEFNSNANHFKLE